MSFQLRTLNVIPKICLKKLNRRIERSVLVFRKIVGLPWRQKEQLRAGIQQKGMNSKLIGKRDGEEGAVSRSNWMGDSCLIGLGKGGEF